MEVLGARVLIEEVMIRKKSVIIVPGKNVNPDHFDVSHKVLKIGLDVPANTILKVGDIPIFTKYVDMNTRKAVVVEEDKKVFHIIVHYDDIAGIDDPIAIEIKK